MNVRKPFAASHWLVLVALVHFFPAAFSTHAQPAASPEYKLKAVFLYNFALFVDWPQDAFSDVEAPIVIGVLGSDPFGTVLDETVRGEIIKNRKIQVKRSASLNELQTCHIIFISNSEQHDFERIFRALDGRPVLTVGDGPRFVRRGGMVDLGVEQKKIKLKINPDTAAAARLTLSAKLLRLAEIVRKQE